MPVFDLLIKPGLSFLSILRKESSLPDRECYWPVCFTTISSVERNEDHIFPCLIPETAIDFIALGALTVESSAVSR